MKRFINIVFGLIVLVAFGAMLPINHDKIPLRWWSGWEANPPLTVLLLFAFLTGVVYAIVIIYSNKLLGLIKSRERQWMNRPRRRAYKLTKRAMELIDDGAYSDARELLRKATETQPRLGIIHEALGRLYTEQGKLEEAVKSFGMAVAYEPENPKPLIRLAETSLAAGDANMAVKALNKIETLKATGPESRRLAPMALAEAGRWEEAVEAQKDLIKKTDKSLRESFEEKLDEYKTELARSMATHNPSGASKMVAEILKKRPGNIPAALLATELLLSKGKTEDAFSTLAATFRHRPEPFLYTHMAEMRANNAFERAENLADEILKKDPRYHALRLAKARARLDRNLAAEALGELEKISGSPTFEHMVVEAAAKFKLGNAQEAKQSIDRAVEAMPTNYVCSACGWNNHGWSAVCPKCRSCDTMTCGHLNEWKGGVIS